MRFRYFSDLHLEKDVELVKRATIDDVWSPIVQPGDSETVLILAGDIWNGTRPLMYAGRSWLQGLAQRFKHVVCVLGNHDYWGASADHLAAKWRYIIKEFGFPNVTLLEVADGPEHGSVVIDGVRIAGGTIWTNMDRGAPLVVTKFDTETGWDGRPLWNDQNFIRAGNYTKFKAAHWLRIHRKSLDNLALALDQGDEPILLVTHHAPCLVSAPPRDSDPLSRFLYASDLSDFILDRPRIKMAVHGHTHEALDYLMGDVRVMCNPRGYAPSLLVRKFNEQGAVTFPA